MNRISVNKNLPQVILDVRYATEQNVTGKKLYDNDELTLPPAVLADFQKACQAAEDRGYRVVLFDAWRDEVTQQRLLEACDDERYVRKQSNHTIGKAVDVSLADVSGQYLDMGSDFDAFGEVAHVAYDQLSKSQLLNRQLLQQIMAVGNFTPWPYEWWHFDHTG